MLVLERKWNESFVVGEGENQITVVVTRLDRGRVWLGIDAPQDVKILRTELLGEEPKALTSKPESA